MRNIGINVNKSKDKEGKILSSIINIIKNIILNSDIRIFYDTQGLTQKATKDLDFIMSLGGDGTLLGTAREIARYNIPIMGVNIGNLGFLTEVESSEVEEAIYSIQEGRYYLEDRIMLDCNIVGDGKYGNFIGLNDVVLSKGTLARMAKYEIYIDDKFYSSFTADGVIVSTPTGSTAYSLSAGGPIMFPDLKLMSITPICPHSLGARTIVIDGSSKVCIRIMKKYESVFLTVDGQQSLELSEKDRINISMSNNKCRLIKLDGYDYFNILRKKITSRTKECEGDKE
ncbi:NAD(+)/NADH kinase [Clostridium sp. SYSU_GA19001]|uniref:NAD(+)/NADH kinase n=1 Tax=Clostridium caldaquaticum TaxID=2940653 RepID=UPI00207783AE|nr:NAD(+)/NADH kinase [Clostridium caldaquaticum]MCM8711052.1 NAD(+)/NADH kinase [Clostridium caldaquaticum]